MFKQNLLLRICAIIVPKTLIPSDTLFSRGVHVTHCRNQWSVAAAACTRGIQAILVRELNSYHSNHGYHGVCNKYGSFKIISNVLSVTVALVASLELTLCYNCKNVKNRCLFTVLSYIYPRYASKRKKKMLQTKQHDSY